LSKKILGLGDAVGIRVASTAGTDDGGIGPDGGIDAGERPPIARTAVGVPVRAAA
jgi:hypothetical protein